jgi:hypothetical protein
MQGELASLSSAGACLSELSAREESNLRIINSHSFLSSFCYLVCRADVGFLVLSPGLALLGLCF